MSQVISSHTQGQTKAITWITREDALVRRMLKRYAFRKPWLWHTPTIHHPSWTHHYPLSVTTVTTRGPRRLMMDSSPTTKLYGVSRSWRPPGRVMKIGLQPNPHRLEFLWLKNSAVLPKIAIRDSFPSFQDSAISIDKQTLMWPFVTLWNISYQL